MTPKEFILSKLVPHDCSVESCGTTRNPHHAGCFELSSDDFIAATQMTELRACGNPLAPDWQYHWATWSKSWNLDFSFEDIAYRELPESRIDPLFPDDTTEQITLIKPLKPRSQKCWIAPQIVALKKPLESRKRIEQDKMKFTQRVQIRAFSNRIKRGQSR